MSTDGWKNFGRYGADRDPGNVHEPPWAAPWKTPWNA